MTLRILPGVCYIHKGDHVATRLRGLAAYREMVDQFTHGPKGPGGTVFTGRAIHDEEGDEGGFGFWVYSHFAMPQRTPDGTLVRVLAPASEPLVDTLEELSSRAVIIVDVFHPVDTMADTIGFEPADSPLHDADQEMSRFLMAPGGEAHAQLTRAMRLAHAVTVPDFEPTIRDACRYNDRVCVLPDLRDEDDPAALDTFAKAFTAASTSAIGAYSKERRYQ